MVLDSKKNNRNKYIVLQPTKGRQVKRANKIKDEKKIM